VLQPFLYLLANYPDYPVHKLAELRELDPESRVPIVLAHELLELAIKDTGDTQLGLKAGRLVEYGDHGALDFAIASASTVEESIQIAMRYMRLLSDALIVNLEIAGEQALVRLESRVPLPIPSMEYQASCWHSSRTRRYPDWLPQLEWWFPYPEPPNSSEYARTFAPAGVRFGAPCFGYAFSKDHLYAQTYEANPKLNAVLRSHAERLLAELPVKANLTERVRHIITKDIALGNINADHVSRRLHLGVRTLGRRLEEEGTTFSAILDDTRRRLAERYVGATSMQFAEIALLVGFSDVAVFYRAFRRWTQQTPREYRHDHAASAATAAVRVV
jgi:AraC-like DNA-binding protein